MAITYLESTNSGKWSNVTSPQNFDHTTGSNTNFLIVVVAGYDDSVTDCECTGVSSNQAGALTKAVNYEAACGGVYGSSSVWYVATSGALTHTISVSFSAKTTNADATAISVSGVDTGTPLADTDSASNSGNTTTLTCSSGDFQVAHFTFGSGDAATTSTSDTELSANEDDLGSAISLPAYGTDLTIIGTDTGGNNSLGTSASFNAAAASSSSSSESSSSQSSSSQSSSSSSSESSSSQSSSSQSSSSSSTAATNGFQTSSPTSANGDTQISLATGQYVGQQFVCPGSGTQMISEIGGWLDSDTGGGPQSRNVKFAIYTHDAANNEPESAVTNSTTTGTALNTSTKTKTYFTYSTRPALTAGTTYWLVYVADGDVSAYYSAVGSNAAQTVTAYPGTWPDNVNWANLSGYDFEIYAVYEQSSSSSSSESSSSQSSSSSSSESSSSQSSSSESSSSQSSSSSSTSTAAGATEFVVTVKSSGGDFTTINTATNNCACGLTIAWTGGYDNASATVNQTNYPTRAGLTWDGGGVGTLHHLSTTAWSGSDAFLVSVSSGALADDTVVYADTGETFQVNGTPSQGVQLTIEFYVLGDTTNWDSGDSYWTGTSATCYVKVITPIANRHQGKWNTAYPYWIPSGAVDIRAYSISHARFEGLQIRVATPTTAALRFDNAADYGEDYEFWVEDCIVRGGSSRALSMQDQYVGGKLYVSNSVFDEGGGVVQLFSLRALNYAATFYLYNITVRDSNNVGIRVFDANVTTYMKNIIATGSSVSDFQFSNGTNYLDHVLSSDDTADDVWTTTNIVSTSTVDAVETNKLVDADGNFTNVKVGMRVKNASDTTWANVTATGTTNLTLDADIFDTVGHTYEVGAVYINATVTFADTDDCHLDSTDTGARGKGTNLSSDSYYPITTDIDEDTRSAWDLGADEFTGGSSSSSSLSSSSESSSSQSSSSSSSESSSSQSSSSESSSSQSSSSSSSESSSSQSSSSQSSSSSSSESSSSQSSSSQSSSSQSSSSRSSLSSSSCSSSSESSSSQSSSSSSSQSSSSQSSSSSSSESSSSQSSSSQSSSSTSAGTSSSSSESSSSQSSSSQSSSSSSSESSSSQSSSSSSSESSSSESSSSQSSSSQSSSSQSSSSSSSESSSSQSSSSQSSCSSSVSQSSSSSSWSSTQGYWAASTDHHCWGQINAIEGTVHSFSDGGTTGEVLGSGDSEYLHLTPGETWVSNVVHIVTEPQEVRFDKYGGGTGHTPTVQWRQGASVAACEVASWTTAAYNAALTHYTFTPTEVWCQLHIILSSSSSSVSSSSESSSSVSSSSSSASVTSSSSSSWSSSSESSSSSSLSQAGSLLTESFEGSLGPNNGYDNADWTETFVGDPGAEIDPDSTDITPPTGGGSETLMLYMSPTASCSCHCDYDFGSYQNITYHRWYFYVPYGGIGNGFRPVYAILGATQGAIGYVQIKQDDASFIVQVRVYNNGTYYTHQEDILPTNSWHYMELYYNGSGAQVNSRIDGTVGTTVSLTGEYYSNGMQIIRLGQHSSIVRLFRAYYDLIEVNDNDYPGA